MKDNEAVAKVLRKVLEAIFQEDANGFCLKEKIFQEIQARVEDLSSLDRMAIRKAVKDFPEDDPMDPLQLKPCLAAIAIADHPVIKTFSQTLSATLVYDFMKAAKTQL